MKGMPMVVEHSDPRKCEIAGDIRSLNCAARERPRAGCILHHFVCADAESPDETGWPARRRRFSRRSAGRSPWGK
eukprot:10495531-Alexandrium_andersonii.AAC.1